VLLELRGYSVASIQSTASFEMGVVNDCKHVLLELKRMKVHRCMVFKIEEKTKQVVIEKIGVPTERLDDFVVALSRMIVDMLSVYDFNFSTNEMSSKAISYSSNGN